MNPLRQAEQLERPDEPPRRIELPPEQAVTG